MQSAQFYNDIRGEVLDLNVTVNDTNYHILKLKDIAHFRIIVT